MAYSMPHRTIFFPVELVDQLKPHAVKRGITVNTLTRMIIGAVVDDNLIDGVLDDGGTLDKAAEEKWGRMK